MAQFEQDKKKWLALHTEVPWGTAEGAGLCLSMADSATHNTAYTNTTTQKSS